MSTQSPWLAAKGARAVDAGAAVASDFHLNTPTGVSPDRDDAVVEREFFAVFLVAEPDCGAESLRMRLQRKRRRRLSQLPSRTFIAAATQPGPRNVREMPLPPSWGMRSKSGAACVAAPVHLIKMEEAKTS